MEGNTCAADEGVGFRGATVIAVVPAMCVVKVLTASPIAPYTDTSAFWAFHSCLVFAWLCPQILMMLLLNYMAYKPFYKLVLVLEQRGLADPSRRPTVRK
eukprot:32460-Eustigmatos_ZCMA.PRE.1